MGVLYTEGSISFDFDCTTKCIIRNKTKQNNKRKAKGISAMCSNGRQCIYAKTIYSFFKKEQSSSEQVAFYLWLLDKEGEYEKERYLREMFDSYYNPFKKNECTEKLFFEIINNSKLKNESESAKQ